jgi:hypothetical protein
LLAPIAIVAAASCVEIVGAGIIDNTAELETVPDAFVTLTL